MHSLKKSYLSALLVLFCASSFAAETVITPDLAKINQSSDWTVHNRKATFVKDNQHGSVSFDANGDMGVAWLKNVEMADGVIEVDLKGSDAKNQSFVGIAFHGLDEITYETVYFRPFNFKAPDAEHKGHAVQYDAVPAYPWFKLREEMPGKYENALTPMVNPNDFFHVKIVLEKQQVRVYVNHAAEPTLAVAGLGAQKSGKVGLWMGMESKGEFKNLTLTPADKK